MKFIHTADWHLGKIVHGVHMTENQRHTLQHFIRLIEEEKPDAVIIAGDLYDRSVPPTEAVELLNETLYTINIEMQTPVIAISGNHDSAERLSFGSSWYRKSLFYIEGKLQKSFSPIQIKGVNFYPVPYAEPGLVRALFDDESIHSHQDAMKAIIGEIEKTMNMNEPNVFIGHAFVLGGKETESERILSVGGSGCVSADVFAPFSYTALGHLHSPDAIKHEKIAYSGSLLKYSFSEAKQKKSVSIIEMEADGSFKVTYKSLEPKWDMRELEGYLEELLDPAFYQSQKVDDFLKVTLLDEGTVLDPIHKLRQVYPNVLHLERKTNVMDEKRKQVFSSVKDTNRSELDLFEMFYSQMTQQAFDEQKRAVMTKIIENVRKESDEW
jgi:exonuclease SbcD